MKRSQTTTRSPLKSGAAALALMGLCLSTAGFATAVEMPTAQAQAEQITNTSTGESPASVTSENKVAADQKPNSNISTDSMVVNGVPSTLQTADTVTCAATTDKPTIDAADHPNADNTLTITGKGYCNSISGGALVSFKIDEGDYSRLDDSVNKNRTIWAQVKADDHNGTFTYKMPLPDGTTAGKNGSNPAFVAEGEHIIRALTGSAQTGDPKSNEADRFVIGKYAPTADPDPISPNDDLTAANGGGLGVEIKENAWVVTVPKGKEGDWVYPSLYLADTSPRAPWSGKYFQLDKDKKFTVPVAGKDLGEGTRKFVVQDVSQGAGGKVLGWATIKGGETNPDGTTKPYQELGDVFVSSVNELNSAIGQWAEYLESKKGSETADGDSADGNPADGNTADGVAEQGEVLTVPEDASAVNVPHIVTAEGAAMVSAPVIDGVATGSTTPAVVGDAAAVEAAPIEDMPQDVPKPPVERMRDLKEDMRGPVKVTVNGTAIDVAIEGAQQGQWVYLTVYAPEETIGLGWAQTDAEGKVYADLVGMKSGLYKIAVQGSAGELIGWDRADIKVDLAAQESSTGAAAPVAAAKSGPLTSTNDLLMILGAVVLVQAMAMGGYVFVNRRRV